MPVILPVPAGSFFTRDQDSFWLPTFLESHRTESEETELNERVSEEEEEEVGLRGTNRPVWISLPAE